MNAVDRRYDDLTVISGIGPARQRWLRESFDVRTFQDLADLSVDQIETQLKADGQIPSRDAIIAWLLQAEELAASAAQKTEPDGVPAIDTQAAAQANSLKRENGWKPFASFVVEFQNRENAQEKRQTAVHHMEEDTGTTWPGIETEQLCDWMLEQIGERLEPEPEEDDLAAAEPTEREPSREEPARVAVTQIRVFQPPQDDAPIGILEPQEPFPGAISSSLPFALEVSFGLSGGTASNITAGQARYLVRSYAYDQRAEIPIHLGETEPTAVEEKKYAYTLTLPEATLQPGTYRVWVTVGFEDVQIIPDYVEVPLLQVT